MNWDRAFQVGSGLIFGYALMMAFSRGVWLAVFIGAGIFLLVSAVDEVMVLR